MTFNTLITVITAVNSTQIEDEFVEAKNNCGLEKLYVNLISAKGKALMSVENKFLRSLLCGFTSAEIANGVYQSRSSSTVEFIFPIDYINT